MKWRESLLEALQNFEPLLALVSPSNMHDGAGKALRFPHVILGGSEMRPYDTQTSHGEEHLLSLHIWSRAANARETQNILDALDQFTSLDPPIHEDFHFVSMRNVFWSAIASPEAGLFHGLMRLRIVIERKHDDSSIRA